MLSDIKTYLNDNNFPFQLDGEGIVLSLKISTTAGSRKSFEIFIREMDGKLIVSELTNILPKCCPNRHINSDGSFCLGIQNNLNVAEWIKQLKEFLRAQLFCETNRKWSVRYKQWSHGNASIYQSKVEALLKEIDLKKLDINLNHIKIFELENQMFNEPFFHVYHNESLIVMGTAKKAHCKKHSCICVRYGKRRHLTVGKCPKKCADLVLKISINEHLRRKEEEKFWETFKKSNVKCCQTMEKCELNGYV